MPALQVRPATESDIPAVLDCVQSLIRELSGRAGFELPARSAEACQSWIADGAEGAIFVAAAEGEAPRAVLTASVQPAVRMGGEYLELQEFWVEPSLRSTGIGARLLAAAEDFCRCRSIDTVEVGLPPDSFAGIESTSRFYERLGVRPVGPRKRKHIQ
jgi:GNAT superfamily N-acetyltransferase